MKYHTSLLDWKSNLSILKKISELTEHKNSGDAIAPMERGPVGGRREQSPSGNALSRPLIEDITDQVVSNKHSPPQQVSTAPTNLDLSHFPPPLSNTMTTNHPKIHIVSDPLPFLKTWAFHKAANQPSRASRHADTSVKRKRSDRL